MSMPVSENMGLIINWESGYNIQFSLFFQRYNAIYVQYKSKPDHFQLKNQDKNYVEIWRTQGKILKLNSLVEPNTKIDFDLNTSNYFSWSNFSHNNQN